MQPDYKYKTYRPRSTTGQATYDYKPSTFTTTPITDEQKVQASLQSQKENLKTRLEAVGVTPDDLSTSAVDNRSIMEKALNLDADQGMLMDLFEVLDRPVQMTKGLISGLAQGEDPFKAAWDGLSGQTEISSAELLQDLGVIEDPEQLGGFGKFALNVAGDMLLDPMTYFGGPLAWMKKGGLLGKKQVTEQILTSVVTKANKLGGSFGSIDDLIKRADELKNIKPTNKVDEFIKQSILDEADVLAKFDMVDGETGKLIGATTDLKKATGKEIRFASKGPQKKGTKGLKFEQDSATGTFKLIKKKFGDLSDNIFVATGKASDIFDDVNLIYRQGNKYIKSAVKMDVKGMLEEGVKVAARRTWANLYGPHLKVTENGTLEITEKIVEEKTKKVTMLLDNAGQG